MAKTYIHRKHMEIVLHNKSDEIFRRCTTYYYSTKVFLLTSEKGDSLTISFVADDYVDAVPQNTKGFMQFKDDYCVFGGTSDNEVINEFVAFTKREFDSKWVDAFYFQWKWTLENQPTKI